MPDEKPTDNEIIKEIQGIKESMKRHIDLTNEMGQDLLRIDEEYTGGSKVWLTTDYFKKVVKHFCHSNYLVKCLELVFDLINRLQAENERLRTKCENTQIGYNFAQDDIKTLKKEKYKLQKALNQSEDYRAIAKVEAYKEFDELLKEDCLSCPLEKGDITMLVDVESYNNLLKEMVGEDK